MSLLKKIFSKIWKPIVYVVFKTIPNQNPHYNLRDWGYPPINHAHNVLCVSIGRKREEWTHDDPNLSRR